MALKLCENLLIHLEVYNTADTLDLSYKFKEDHQKIVGAVKSLLSLGNLITAEQRNNKKWELTDEGKMVVEKGSHEVHFFNAVPSNGIAQAEIMKVVLNPKIGFSKAMLNGWITLDKKGGVPVISKKVDSVKDVVQEHLILILNCQAHEVSDNQKQEYKKRKLVQEVVIKSYALAKGKEFSLYISKPETDLTPEMIASGSWKEKTFKPYNFDALGVPAECGHLHPLLKVRSQFRQIFLEMGFTEMPTNNFVENSFWNFDALFQPQQHPARDAHDTFFVSEPAQSCNLPPDYVDRVRKVHSEGGYGSQGYRYHWKLEEACKNLLRTHTTAVSARMLYKLVQDKDFVPVKYFSIDRVFRNETLDATHLAEFHQVEGVVADYNLGLGDLIGTLHEFFGKLGITQLHFKPAYNPYTEPSMEIFSYHTGLRKWIEVGNSGIFRPEMLHPMGIPENVNVIAWGLSLERPTMIKYKLNNIRDLVGPKVDLKMVYDSPICRLDKDTTSMVDVMKVMDSHWDSICSDLGALQTQVASLQTQVVSLQLDCHVQQKVQSTKRCVVIVADPRHPPYSMCILLKLLSDACCISSSIHMHSSIKHVAPQLMHLFNHADVDDYDLSVVLIWKEVGVNPVLVESPFNHQEIIGEVNIARYFNRLLESKGNFTLAYECKGEVLSGLVDTWMDKIYSSIIHGQNKEYLNVLNNLKILFKKQRWLAGSSISVADICLWSVFKRSELVDSFPSEVKQWYENCCQGLCYLP